MNSLTKFYKRHTANTQHSANNTTHNKSLHNKRTCDRQCASSITKRLNIRLFANFSSNLLSCSLLLYFSGVIYNILIRLSSVLML